MAALRAWKRRQAEELLALGVRNPEGWVWTSEDGTRVHEHTTIDAFKRDAGRVGLAFLVDVLAPRLVALHAELGEFFRKEDYRYRQEPRGAEQTAWRRTIAQLVGPPELALPGTGLRDGR
ncbi:MAG: hypothetical protein HY691_00685 [Chloroflexi bacterium]|nr:hypothetical protein [Chloroflexota bacterium]